MLIEDRNLNLVQKRAIDFSEEEHSYMLDGKKLPSVTSLLKEANLGANYNVVNEEILEQAKMRGEAIHYQIEDVIKNNDYNEIGNEARQILDYLQKDYWDKKTNEWVNIISEGKIANTNYIKPYAGRFDLLGKKHDGEYILYDIKTMKSWNGRLEEYTRWQLSLYAKALEELGIIVKSLIVLKFKTIDKDRYELNPIEVKRIDDCKLADFLENGFVKNELITLSQNEYSLFYQIKQKEEELKQLEEQVKTVKDAIYNYMLDNDILSTTSEDGTIKMTRTKDSIVEGLDVSKIRQEEPVLFAKYKKETRRKGFLKITIK